MSPTGRRLWRKLVRGEVTEPSQPLPAGELPPGIAAGDGLPSFALGLRAQALRPQLLGLRVSTSGCVSLLSVPGLLTTDRASTRAERESPGPFREMRLLLTSLRLKLP